MRSNYFTELLPPTLNINFKSFSIQEFCKVLLVVGIKHNLITDDINKSGAMMIPNRSGVQHRLSYSGGFKPRGSDSAINYTLL